MKNKKEKIISKLLKERKLIQEQDSDYVWENSGCLDPDDPNFCSGCQYDCVGEPHDGVETGLFGWNWSSGNDDLGHTCCCQNDYQYNPTGEPQPENVLSACCYTNTNPGGTYTTEGLGQQDGSYYFTCDYWTDDYFWDNPNNPNYEQNIWDNSGCLDPDDPNYCADCNYDCVGEPHDGVITGFLDWNWSEGNDDLGHTCCCFNDPQYNPWGTTDAGDVTSRCCFPNTNVGGDYVAPEVGICEDPVEGGEGGYQGCLDPAAANFNPNATEDCVGVTYSGLNTGLFGWDWSVGNNNMGNQCCCDYSNGNEPSGASDPDTAWDCNDYYIYQNGESDFWNNYIWGDASGCSRFDDLPFEQQVHMCNHWFNKTYPNQDNQAFNVAYYWFSGGLDINNPQDPIIEHIHNVLQPFHGTGVGSDLQIINGGLCCEKIGEVIGDNGWDGSGYNNPVIPYQWIPDTAGCMDENASNYNWQANVDDGSCEYEDEDEDDGGNTFVDPGKAPFANKPKKLPIQPPKPQPKPQMRGKLNEQVKRMQKLAGIKKKK